MMVDKVIKQDFVSIDGCDTFAKLLRKRFAEWPDQVAMREKNFGIWENFTWGQVAERSRIISSALLAIGMQPGNVASILSEDNKEWLWSDFAITMIGGVLNGIYPTYQAEQIQHILLDSDTRILLVEDEEQLDKFLNIEGNLPDIIKVVVFDWKGLRGFQHEKVISFDDFCETGKQHLDSNLHRIDQLIDQGKNEDVILLVYTSGTTGKPKGTEISNRYALFTSTVVPDLVPMTHKDELLTYLPLCHIAERAFSIYMPIASGSTISFAESPETIFQNLQELSPTILFAVPRIWEKFYSRVRTLMSESTRIGRFSYDMALAVGKMRAEKLIKEAKPSAFLELIFKVVDRVVFRNIKQLIGLNRAHYMLSGAAPISDELLKWFLALGLPVYEVYGQTETGVSTLPPLGKFRPGKVGMPIPGVEVKLGEQQEIMIRSPSLLTRYRNNPEATEKTLVDGWVRTGDVGEIDEENFLTITDRIKDIIITAGGKNITPSLIENKLKFSPYISDAVVIGDKRKYLTCLIMIDLENVEHYAQTNSIPFTDYKSLCAAQEIQELIQGEIDEVNKQFSSVESIRKFRLIDILLTAEDDELTPTMKLKRSFVAKKYESLINQMY